MVAANPDLKVSEDSQLQTILGKIEALSNQLLDSLNQRDLLEEKCGSLQAEINDLKLRIAMLETNRERAREELQKIVAQLPEK